MPHLNGVGATSVAQKVPLHGTLPSGPEKARHYLTKNIDFDIRRCSLQRIQVDLAGEKGGGRNQEVTEGDGLKGKVILQIKKEAKI